MPTNPLTQVLPPINTSTALDLDSELQEFVNLEDVGSPEDSLEALEANVSGKEYIRKKPPQLKITQYLIDPYSVELLKMGQPGQLYVINDFLDIESGIIYRYYTPSFTDSASLELAKKALFKIEDLVEGTVTTTGSGIVHERAKDVILERHGKSLLTSHKHLLTKFMMGGASVNYKVFKGRSTHNLFVFRMKELAKYALYFEGQTEFTIAWDAETYYHLNRTKPWKPIELGITATLDALEKSGVIVGDRSAIMEASQAECYPHRMVQSLGGASFFLDKQKLAEHLMHTVYVASGLVSTGRAPTKGIYVLQNALRIAKQYGITLKIDEIPKNFNAKQANGATALLHAAKTWDDIECLLEYGANIHAKDNDGSNALHYAMKNKYAFFLVYSIIDPLVKYGADITAQNNNGDTPFHIAVKEGNEAAVEYCVTDKNAVTTLFEKNLDGDTPLDIAIKNQNLKILELIIPLLKLKDLNTLLQKDVGHEIVKLIENQIVLKEVRMGRCHFFPTPKTITEELNSERQDEQELLAVSKP